MSLDIQIPTLSVNLNQFAQQNNFVSKHHCQKQERNNSVSTHQQQKPDRYSTNTQNLPSRSSEEGRIKRFSRKLKQSLPNVNTPKQPKMRRVHIPRPSEMREKFQPDGTSGWLLFGWSLSSILAIIIPVAKWATERNKYYKYYGKYNQYEQQQRQYENGNYNGNYNNGGNWGNMCSWWNIRCRYRMRRYAQQYGNGNGSGDGGGQEQAQMSAMLPDWYFFFGGSVEDDDREREEMGMSSNEGSMKFVYACTIMMFIGVSIYGFRSMYAGQDRAGVIAALLIFGQFSLMNLLTTVQGTVETDGRFFEESVYGWFGQWSVLVAYTDFWIMLHCFIFAAGLSLTRCLDKRAQQSVAVEQSQQENLEMGYRHSEDPRDDPRYYA